MDPAHRPQVLLAGYFLVLRKVSSCEHQTHTRLQSDDVGELFEVLWVQQRHARCSNIAADMSCAEPKMLFENQRQRLI
jgi:hypothetical protein